MGWKQEGGPATRRSLPPVEFHKTQPVVQEIVEEVDQESLGNLPIGLDNNVYRWTDLHGEGIPGILTEQEGTQIWRSQSMTSTPPPTVWPRKVSSLRWLPCALL